MAARGLAFRQRLVVLLAGLILIGVASSLYLTLLQPQLEPSLVVYGPKGIRTFANKAVTVFSGKYGVNASFVHYGMGSIEIANKLISEKDHPMADVIMGLPEFYARPVIEAGVLEKHRPPNLREIPASKIWDSSGYIVPMDEGYVVIVYNETMISERHVPAPSTLDDLLDPRFRGLVTYPNPVTSGTGLSFLTWVLKEKGEAGGWEYLDRLKGNIVFYPSGWTEAMDAFIKGEAAVGVMFNTDTVYSETPDLNSTMQKGFVYREGIALVKGAPHSEAAKKFIEFMLSKEAQDIAGPYGYVYPVRPDALGSLKDDIAKARLPEELVRFDASLAGNADVWRKKWQQEILLGE